MSRFEVVTVTGYRITPDASSGGSRYPGLSATVIDAAIGSEIATYCSERSGRLGNSPAGHQHAVAKAETLAAKLNAEHDG